MCRFAPCGRTAVSTDDRGLVCCLLYEDVDIQSPVQIDTQRVRVRGGGAVDVSRIRSNQTWKSVIENIDHGGNSRAPFRGGRTRFGGKDDGRNDMERAATQPAPSR